jgi:hypothetical protein
MAIWIAALVYAFALPLQKLDPEAPPPRRWNLWIFPFRTVFVFLLCLYLWFLAQEVLHHVP